MVLQPFFFMVALAEGHQHVIDVFSILIITESS